MDYNLVDKFWYTWEGIFIGLKALYYEVLSLAPVHFFYLVRFGLHQGILWVEYMIVVQPRVWMMPSWDFFSTTGLYYSLSFYGYQLYFTAVAASHVFQTLWPLLGESLRWGVHAFYSLVATPWTDACVEAVAQSDTVLYGRWLWHYALLDFCN